MQDECCTGYSSDATVEAHPRPGVTYDNETENSEESDSSTGDSETEGGSSDRVQCVSCYRVYCRQSWYDWPVVAGHERECARCVAQLLSDAPTVVRMV